MEVDADDDWAKRARAGFFSSPRSLFSEPDEGASSWAPPAHAPATVTRHSSHNAQFNTSDTLTPRGPALPGTGPVRGFVPTSRSLGSRDSAFSRTSREPWTPEDPTPLASAEPTNYSQSLGRLRPRPLSFAFDVANSSVPQTLFGNAIREPHSGLYDHPPLAISRDVNGRSLPPAVPRTPPAQRGEGNAMAASRVAKKRKGSKEKSSSSRQAKSAAEKQVQKTTVSTSIDSLPDEILIQILKLVRGEPRKNQPIKPSNLHPLLFVNRRLCLLASTLVYQNPRPTSLLKGQLLLRELGRSPFDPPFSSLTGSVTHLDLSSAYQQGSDLDLGCLSSCFRLQTLNVSNANSLKSLDKLLRHGSARLHTLIARDSTAIDASLIERCFRPDLPCVQDGVLKRIDFGGCLNLTDQAVCYLVDLLHTQLASLKIGRCKSVSDAAVSYVAERCRKLATLDIERLEGLSLDTVFGKLILQRQGCPELAELSITGIRLKEDGLQEQLFQIWAGEIAANASRYGPEVSSDLAIQLPIRAPKQTLASSLKSLNLSGISFLTAPVLHILLAFNQKLDVLKVSQCAGIAESSVSQFRDMISACLNMRTLFLSRTPLPASVLSRMLSPKLSVLDLSDNSALARQVGVVTRPASALTDSTVAMICQNCPNLRALHLARNPQLTDQTLFSLMALYKSLRKVSVQRCRLMTAGNLRGFLNVCGRLEWIDVSDIPDICRPELQELGSFVAQSREVDTGTGDSDKSFLPLILEGKIAIAKARTVLNSLQLLFLPPSLPPQGDDGSDDHPQSAGLSAWSSARTTPTKSSKSASIHTSCCPSDAESASEDGGGFLKPGSIRRSRRLKKRQCYRHRAKYHHLPELPHVKAAATRLQEHRMHELQMTPPSVKSSNSEASTPPDTAVGSASGVAIGVPRAKGKGPATAGQSPRRKELASLFAALSSDGAFEDVDDY